MIDSQKTRRTRRGRRPGRLAWLDSFLWLAAIVGCSTNLSAAVPLLEPLFEEPSPARPHAANSDEVLLVSTRRLGLSCKPASMRQTLECQRREGSSTGQITWQADNWQRLLAPLRNLLTVVYVHGNRVARGRDREQGMQVYRSLKSSQCNNTPIRFVIWSWPSAQIPGPVKDYLVKAQRTNPAAWQLAWLLDKLPVETKISLVGYSYGARVVSGATHLLAGGHLDGLQLAERLHPQRRLVSLALLAAAYNADWIQPGSFYGKSMTQTQRLVLAVNEHDPAMRFYHFGNGLGRIHALGKSGVHRPQTLGSAANRLQHVDFKREVGRSHSLKKYLGANSKMAIFWQDLLPSLQSANSDISPGLEIQSH